MKGVKTVIIYKQTGGKVCADGAAVDAARLIMSDGRTEVEVSTGLIIDAVRVMLVTGEISVDEVEFQFEGEVLPHTEVGRITNWPNGFNDTMEGLLMQIL
jgi:hypothetical protein